MSDKIFCRVKDETVFYGNLRRRPAEYEEVDGVMQLKRKADIFMLRDRHGIGANGKPITLTAQDQLRSFAGKVEVIDVTREDIHRVKVAQKEVSDIVLFEKQQEELDEIDSATAIINAKEMGVSEEAKILTALDHNPIDTVQEKADLATFTERKTQEELDAEAALKEGNVAGGETPAPVSQGSGNSEGTGNRSVL